MDRTIAALDLNHLRIFERVAALGGFSAAASALGLPKSNVSRSVALLEEVLGTRLLQRTTRKVTLTSAGEALQQRCSTLLTSLHEALDYVSSFAETPSGPLRIGCGIGFGINALTELLPGFLQAWPEVRIELALSTRTSDLVGEQIDCAIRLGPLPASSLMSIPLGAMSRYLCASPEYLNRRGAPQSISDLVEHDIVEMPGSTGRPRPWIFERGGETVRIDPMPRVSVDEALAIHRLVRNGAGIGIISGYLCGYEVLAGRLVQLLSDWRCPLVPVSLVFPSRRELAPSVRAFADHLKAHCQAGKGWMEDPLVHNLRQGRLS
jgi:LysR family transcriptional regulator for bpeEF and oprC